MSGRRKRDPRAEALEGIAGFLADIAQLLANYSDEIVDWFETRRAKRSESK